MNFIFDPKTQRVPIKSWCDYPEESALAQAISMANHPAVFHHVALMPDAHTGMGVPIGGVMALENAVSPSAVGVDIGCGMCAVKTGHKLGKVQGKLKSIRQQIIRDIPVGHCHRSPQWVKTKYPDIHDEFLTDEARELIECFMCGATEGRVTIKKVLGQIGTLGGGNHFIEIQKDENNNVWVMLHSGSRNFGKQVADIFHKKAAELNAMWHSALPDKALAFLPLDHELGKAYLNAMNIALEFARLNRKAMMRLVAEAFAHNKLPFPDGWEEGSINIHHNYAALEHHYKRNVVVHRKGATLARKGTMGIIPGSMGTCSYIVRGKGCEDSFTSCSHGAGRKMSRSQAKKTIEMDAYKRKMAGIEFEPTKDNLDEAPQAYKDIGDVMRQQEELVEIVEKLLPLAVVKG